MMSSLKQITRRWKSRPFGVGTRVMARRKNSQHYGKVGVIIKLDRSIAGERAALVSWNKGESDSFELTADLFRVL